MKYKEKKKLTEEEYNRKIKILIAQIIILAYMAFVIGFLYTQLLLGMYNEIVPSVIKYNI